MAKSKSSNYGNFGDKTKAAAKNGKSPVSAAPATSSPAYVCPPPPPAAPAKAATPSVPAAFAAPVVVKTNAPPAKRTVTRDQIAKRAYEIWVAKGRPAGQDLQNWQQAERELLAKF
jgi:hypothetical protein